MSTLFFIRHGQASFGKGDYDKLSERGSRQARRLAEYFNERHIRFDAAYSGTLNRHIETAGSFTDACEYPMPNIVKLDGLNEYHSREILMAFIPVLLEEQPEYGEHTVRLLEDKKSFQRVFEAVMTMWATGNYDLPGIQRWDEFMYGVNQAIDTVMKNDGNGKRVAIFTSGGPISVVVRRALGLDDARTMSVREQIVNSSYSRFKCTTDRLMMATFNEYPHLEQANDAQLITYR